MGFLDNIFNKLEDMFETEYNAEHAKTKAEKMRRKMIEEENHYIHELIDSAVKRGEFKIRYRVQYQENIDYFKELGYDVKFCDVYSNYYIISW